MLARRSFLILGGTAVLLGGCSAMGKLAGPAGSTPPGRLSAATISTIVNATRKSFGAPVLAYNNALEQAARTQAGLMASNNTMSHTLGGTLRERVSAVNYHDAVGENLGVGYETLEEAIQGWLDSPAHRSTLLNRKFTEFGLAAARGGGRVYWAFIAGGSLDNWRV